MSGSRLGRGRGGRLAVYGGCGVVVVVLVLLYRAATSEMARLRELHVQCAHQQEALAAQLQVIFEYKVRLEKSLAEEKSSNAAVKQELQQRASREKSLRDKDSIEAMQRFNSLQQNYKLLQTEHQDLQEECKKREKQALEDMGRLESTLKELRGSMKQAKQEQHSLERLKTKYLELETEKGRLEDKYNDLMKLSGNNNGTIDHLKKEVFQLKRELEEAKKSSKATSPGPSLVSPQSSQQVEQPALKGAQASANEQNGGVQQQSPASSSTAKSSQPSKPDGSTRSSGNPPPGSTSQDKAVASKPKAKLPLGVVPIPKIPEKADEAGKGEDSAYNQVHKNMDSKENEHLGDAGNLVAPFAGGQPGRHVGGQIIDRRVNPAWLRVGPGPGVQEFGEDLNQRMDEPGDRQVDGGDENENYDADYDKEPPKNSNARLGGAEDEGEEEDEQDYVQNIKPEKRV